MKNPTAMRLVLAALNDDHDSRIGILNETNDPDILRGIANALTHAAAKSWLQICEGDREEAVRTMERLLLDELDQRDGDDGAS